MAGKYDLFVDVTYDVKRGKAKINSNVKREKVRDIISEFLRTQMGKGADTRKAKERDVYHIKIEVDLSQDNFYVTDDTGNKGLRDGILMQTLQQKGLEARV